MRRFLFTAQLLFLALYCQAQSFTELGSSAGLNVGGSKDGGAVWADFDNDGDLDVAINTGGSSSSNTSLYQNNGDGTFTNVTSSKIAAIGTGGECCERSLAWGDLNNDGNIDLIGNTHDRVEIYINRGSPNYLFGVGAGMTANMTITSLTNGMNAEGMGIMDYNNDGWLDLLLENHNYGIDILENQKLDASNTINQTATILVQVTINATGHLGLPTNATDGDYLSTSDFDGDGYMDILGRKRGNSDYDSDYNGTIDATTTGNTNDLWKNNGDGTFSLVTSFSGNDASNSNKGGTVFCDFDSDGDFDIFWTDIGTNQIWLQDPIGTFTATSKPTIPGTPDIDGCACGDVDNDGDTDLFLGNSSGNSYMFVNATSIPNSAADLSFSRTDIAVNANAEGVNLVDYDNDGDADIYINVNGGNNQLWDNDNCDGGGCDFFRVVTQDCIDGTVVTRPAVGATMVLTDSVGTMVNAAQDMNSAMGHGAQNPSVLNFSIPNPNATYTLDITFPAKIIAPSSTPTVETYSFDFVPNTLTNDTLVLTALNASDGSTCDFSVLPIELLYFKAAFQNSDVLLKWATATETNNDFFSIERSSDGRMFNKIAEVKGAGNSSVKNEYSFLDSNPLPGWNYYRLKQTDYDATFTYSQIIIVENIYDNFDFEIYPNPFVDELNIRWSGELNGNAFLKLYDLRGNLLLGKALIIDNSIRSYTWTELQLLSKGTYIIELNLGKMNFGSHKIVKQF